MFMVAVETTVKVLWWQ